MESLKIYIPKKFQVKLKLTLYRYIMKINNNFFFLTLFFVFSSFTMAITEKNKSGKKEIDPTGVNNANIACSVEFTGIGNIQCSGEVINYSIYFDSQEFGTNGYFLIHNGNTTGPHFTLDSIQWGDISYCENQEMLIIYDADEQACRDTFFWETPCCPCEFEFIVEQVECELGQFGALFELNVTSGSCLPYWGSGVFTVNGVQREFEYIGGSSYLVYPIISNLEYNTYRFTFEEPLGEFHEVTLFNTCQHECTIENFSVTQDTSLCSGEFAGLHFDFDAILFGGNGYTITTNQGLVFEFDPGATRYLEMVANCQDSITFTIEDNTTPGCSDSYTVAPICCPCQGTYSEIEKSPCQNNSFNAVHVFDYIEGSCFTGDWTLTQNGIAKEFNWFNNTYLEINDITLPDSLITYELCWEEDPGTCFSLPVTNPCFISEYQCQITFEETALPECVNDSIHTTLLLYGENISFQGYDVYVNDTYYTWLNYENDSIYNVTIANPNTSSYTLRICNNLNQDCCFTRTLDNPCYDHSQDCTIGFDFEGSGPVCINNEIVANWFIFAPHNSGTGFDVFVNDSLVEYLPHHIPFHYPIALPNFGTDTFVMKICDHTYQNCCHEWTLDNPCADYNPACSLVLDTLQTPACINGLIDLNLSIFGDSTSMTEIRVYENYSLVKILPFRPDSIYHFTIQNLNRPVLNLAVCDEGNSGCCAVMQMNNPCMPVTPPCSVIVDTLVAPTCDGDLVSSTLGIYGDSLSMTGFNVYLADTLYTFLPFAGDSMYAVQFPDSQHEFLVVTICDAGNSDCCTEFTISNPCYDPGADCALFFDKVGESVCDSAYVDFTIFIHGEAHSMSGYKIYLDSSLQIVLPYAEDSLYTIRVPDTGRPFFNITVCDEAYPTCCYTREYTNPCYDPNIDCSLHFETISEPVCLSNMVNMEVLIHGENHGVNEYDLYLDGTQFGQISFETDSTYSISIPNNGQSNFHLTICTGDHPSCCQENTYLNPCYSGPDTCDIFIEDVVETSCENGLISMSIQIASQQTSGTGYDVFVNDSILLTLPYALDSIYAFSFSASGENEFILTVCDHQNSACCRGTLLVNPCATQGLCRLDQLESQVSRSGTDSIQLDIQYTTKGVCTPRHKATLWIEQNAPADYIIYEQLIEHTFERMDVDPIVGKLCFSEPFDTCVTMVLSNPFTTGTEGVTLNNIQVFSMDNLIIVHNPSAKEYQYMCTDLLGRQLLVGSSSEIEQIYRLTNSPSGIYLLNILENNKLNTYKLLITTD